MPFPDSVKLEACRKAHFMCVACHAPFVQVHHITPEGEGGPNSLDNAAPLCAGCHAIYGGNPLYRNQIRQMRDNWYDVCEKKFGPVVPQIVEQLSRLSELVQLEREDRLKDQLKYQTTLNEIKGIMLGSLSATAEAVGKAQTFEEVVTASGYPTTGVYLGPSVYANFQCRNCGTYIGLLVGNDKCPKCGTPIKS